METCVWHNSYFIHVNAQELWGNYSVDEGNVFCSLLCSFSCFHDVYNISIITGLELVDIEKRFVYI